MHITAVPEEVGLSSQRLNNIRPWVQRYIDAGKIPGALVMVARHGRVAYLDRWAYRDVEARLPVELDTIFRIYSMSKPITSVAVMMLYEQGLFQLNDPLAAYLPEFSEMQVYVSGEADSMVTETARSPITIQQLLTHTAGFTYGFFDDTPVSPLYRQHRADFEKQSGSLQEVVGRLSELPLVCHPGTAWNYGVSTDVLGRFVEVVSGQQFDHYLEQHIFTPLAMVDTSFVVAKDKLDRFAALYARNEGDGMSLLENAGNSVYVDDVTTFSGGGGLVSTVADYFRFTELMRRKGELNGVRLLGRKTVEHMTSNQLAGDLAAMGQPSFMETTQEGIGFGLGFAVTMDPARAQLLGSAGEYAWGGAASTSFWVDPVEDMTVIFLTQLLPSSSYPLRRELRILTYQALID